METITNENMAKFEATLKFHPIIAIAATPITIIEPQMTLTGFGIRPYKLL